VIYYSGCGEDSYTSTPPGPGSEPERFLILYDLFPLRMPNTNDSFWVTIETKNIEGSMNAHFEFREYRIGSCLAHEKDTTLESVMNGMTFDIPFYTGDFNSNCNWTNTVYKIILTSGSYPNLRDSTYYVRGNPSLSQGSVNIEKACMPQNNTNMCDSIISGVDTSFCKRPDSTGVKITPNIVTSYSLWNTDPDLRDTIFPHFDFDYQFDECVSNYATRIRQYPLNPYFLILAGYQRMYLSPVNVIGYSNNILFSSYGNWSYIFMRNIDSVFRYSTDYFRRTLYTFTTVHELLHQVGNIFKDVDDGDPRSEHTNHTGRYVRSCGLYQPNTIINLNPNYFRVNSGFIRICDRHTFKLRNNLGAIPPLVLHDVDVDHLNHVAGYQNGKYEIRITLPKHIYKKFEPVIVYIQVINHDSKQLELTEGFRPEEKACVVTIADEFGNTTRGNKIPGELTFAYTSPSYVIQTGDTLFTSMAINDWGKKAEKTPNYDSIYFHYGYFESGNYTAYITRWFDLIPDKGRAFYVNSNNVEFEVTELNSEDIEVLRLLKQQRPGDSRYLQEIARMYPNNSFAEHLYAYYLKGHSRTLAYETYDWKDSLISDYQGFIAKYPNSSYLLNDLFVAPYIFKHFTEINNLKDNFEREIENFSSANTNNALKYFLKDSRRTKLILRLE